MTVKKKTSEEFRSLYQEIVESISFPSRDIISAKKLAKRFHIPLEHMEHHLVVLAQAGQLIIGKDNEMIWVRRNK